MIHKSWILHNSYIMSIIYHNITIVFVAIMILVAAPDFLPMRLSQFTLSDRVFCYDRLLLILCFTISVTFTDYDDV